MTSAIQTRGISHAYDRVPVLNDVSLVVAPGERVFIIGANGAGKSTIAKVIAGLVAPRSGAVFLLGEDVTGLPPYLVAQRGLRYVPAYRSVFSYLTVRDNLELGGECSYKASGLEAPDIDYVLAIFPALKTQLNTIAQQLSGGMQRMIEVGRALLGNPAVLILDEPTLGLDGKATSQMSEGLAKLRDGGRTLLVIEQNVPFATSICERGYLMSQGTIVLDGTADELLNSAEVRKTYLGVI